MMVVQVVEGVGGKVDGLVVSTTSILLLVIIVAAVVAATAHVDGHAHSMLVILVVIIGSVVPAATEEGWSLSTEGTGG